MDKLKSLQVFIDIVEQNSITHAAHCNQISATMAGKHLKSLEAELKQVLLTRTTRKLSLTEAGKLYYQSAKHIQQTLLNTENQLQQMQQKPSGNIKLNAPVTFSEIVLAPLIPQFLRRYPEINIELICENRITDPMHDSSDLLIRIGELEDSNLYAQKLGEYQMVFAASPSYINRHDVPTSINDLNLHQCLGFIPNRTGIQQMTADSMPLQTNSGRVLLSAALAGSGIILQPKILIKNALTEGALIQILNDEKPKAKPINIIYKNKPLPLKCKAFMKFLKTNYK